MVGLGRLELPTSRLSGVRSNQLSYRPSSQRGRRGVLPKLPVQQRRTQIETNIDLNFPIGPDAFTDSSVTLSEHVVTSREATSQVSNGKENSKKGGDPATGSPTATLLRLHPNHQPYRRRLPPLRVSSATSSTANFRDVTGGVYKARERIHRGVLIRDY